MVAVSNDELEKVEKHLNQIMDLHQQANKDAFAEIVRRLAPLDTWPNRIDALANDIKDLQKSKAIVEGKADQTDVNNARNRANISIALAILVFLFNIWKMYNP